MNEIKINSKFWGNYPMNRCKLPYHLRWHPGMTPCYRVRPKLLLFLVALNPIHCNWNHHIQQTTIVLILKTQHWWFLKRFSNCLLFEAKKRTANDVVVWIHGQFLIGTNIKKSAGSIIWTSSKCVSRWEERNSVDVRFMSWECLFTHTITNIPEFCRCIACSRNECPHIWRKW